MAIFWALLHPPPFHFLFAFRPLESVGVWLGVFIKLVSITRFFSLSLFHLTSSSLSFLLSDEWSDIICCKLCHGFNSMAGLCRWRCHGHYSISTPKTISLTTKRIRSSRRRKTPSETYMAINWEFLRSTWLIRWMCPGIPIPSIALNCPATTLAIHLDRHRFCSVYRYVVVVAHFSGSVLIPYQNPKRWLPWIGTRCE